MTIEKAKQYILEGGKITEEQALSLVNHPDKEALYEAAHQITRHFMGNKFDTCSIINAKSGNCSEDCKWCAQSGHYKTLVNLYPLLPAKECVYHAVYNRKQGIRRFALVTSGKRVSDLEMEQITDTIRQIKRQSDIKCCASMGLLTRSQLQSLYDSGVENYHCNIDRPFLFPSTLFHAYDRAEDGNHPYRPGNRFPYMLRWYYRHGRDDGGTNRDGLFLTERRCLIHPSQFITADTGNSYGEYTYPRRRGMANNDRPFPLDQSERISPFLRRTGTIKRGHATEIPIYRD